MNLSDKLHMVLIEGLGKCQTDLCQRIIKVLKNKAYNKNKLDTIITHNARKFGCGITDRDLNLMKTMITNYTSRGNHIDSLNDLNEPEDHSPNHTENDSDALINRMKSVPKIRKSIYA